MPKVLTGMGAGPSGGTSAPKMPPRWLSAGACFTCQELWPWWLAYRRPSLNVLSGTSLHLARPQRQATEQLLMTKNLNIKFQAGHG